MVHKPAILTPISEIQIYFSTRNDDTRLDFPRHLTKYPWVIWCWNFIFNIYDIVVIHFSYNTCILLVYTYIYEILLYNVTRPRLCITTILMKQWENIIINNNCSASMTPHLGNLKSEILSAPPCQIKMKWWLLLMSILLQNVYNLDQERMWMFGTGLAFLFCLIKTWFKAEFSNYAKLHSVCKCNYMYMALHVKPYDS